MSGRPEALFPLFAGVETLEGVGPKTAQNLGHLGVQAPRDLLFTLPYSGVDRALRDTVKDAILPATLTVAVTVGTHRPAKTRTGAYRIDVEDAQTAFQLVFFHARGDYWQRQLPEGARRIVSGRVELFDGVAQMVHPDFAVPEDQLAQIPAFEPVYPLTGGVTQKLMYKATRAALARLPDMAEWIDPAQRAQGGWPDFRAAAAAAHDPKSLEDVASTAPARERLAYDELFAHQVTLALARQRPMIRPPRKAAASAKSRRTWPARNG